MATQVINNTDWKTFCERFNREHGGILVTIENEDSSGRRTTVAKDLPLQELKFEQTDCSDLLLFILDCPHRREMKHEITQPLHIRFTEIGEGRKELDIAAESGTSHVFFSSGKMGQILEGLQKD
jgi:hypothetical protein